MFFFFVLLFFIATTASAPFSTVATFLSVVMVFVIFGMAVNHWIIQNEQRKAIASALQLTHTSSGRLEGLYNGFAVSVMYQSGRVAKTEITTRFNKPMPNGLRIYRETAILSDIGKFLGGQDIQTQDAVFDDTFIVKGQPEAHVEKLLTRRVRAAIIRANAVARLELNEKEIVFLDDYPANVEAARALGLHSLLVGSDLQATIRELDALLAS